MATGSDGSDVLGRLPAPSPNRLAARLTPDALRQVRGGHPWVYASAITSITPGHRPGDLAVVFDADRRFAAIGLYDPDSAIPIRILHRGRPQSIDTAFWRGRLSDALHRRAELRAGGQTTGWRWVYGESDGLPGLVLDVYGHVGVIKLYSTAWLPHLAAIVPLAAELGALDAVVIRLGGNIAERSSLLDSAGVHDGTTLYGTLAAGPVLFRENGLTFEADVRRGQKTGHFLDQRDNRALVRAACRGAQVLDVFAATGGFTVYAAAGGARRVAAVDASAPTLDVAARNLAHNASIDAVRRCRLEPVVGDAFAVMRRLAAEGRLFDVVIVDPPSFARRAAQVERAIQAYGDLTALALQLVAPGGLLVQASCTARIDADDLLAAMHAGASRTRRSFDVARVTGHPLDHPIGFPEASYLKAVFARVAPR